MLFSGIELPETIHIPKEDSYILEALAGSRGETVDTYVEASIGLLATWGVMIQTYQLSPHFVHGVADLQAGEIEVFDIPELCDMLDGDSLARRAADTAFGFRDDASISVETTSDNNRISFPVNKASSGLLRIACGYYDRPFQKLASVAMELRNDILTAQLAGKVYTSTADGGETWADIELYTYPAH